MSLHEVRLQGWPENVRVFYTTRDAGHSQAPYDGFNLGLHVGDDAESVLQNRTELQAQLPLGTRIAWLDQVHGTHTVAARDSLNEAVTADASWTADAGIACAVMVADCLPVLLSARSGEVVAAVHAGWRGLADGVLESAVSALGVAPREVCAWLGPVIGRDAFEVGPEVRWAFLQWLNTADCDACFRASGDRPGHYLADLNALARLRLGAIGLREVQSLNACTVSDPSRFFSYRRDGTTGRMACLILRDSPKTSS
ncbi:peptidoglycan editing factor PgeF [Congregibacter sp.]|uniref:peptidoglycan editing factor PgeF n=1 Tax=Congregibacter sp. TaxID=2744308 RepID=UPI003F6C48B9